MALAVGTVVEGVVTGITKFGAFVQLPTGETGLVHISEVADTFVKDVKDYLKEQDRVRVKIINVDERGRIGLSIKQADPNYEPRRRPRHRPNFDASFEEKLARFLKESDDRLQDLKRNVDAKRGGRGAR
ncbi:MAG: S1 RNA-binding domain-containing protein [Clostridia bacterium]|nr:S1 RNA-binding domain-containing protein [Clostridia bacterium]MBC7346480.1 S1 RNA-binding domain-containing protein [Clostridia bacterium]